MDRLFLERPSLRRKADVLAYFEEFTKASSQTHGSGSLDRVLSGWSFEDSLAFCLGMESAAFAKERDRCPGKTFLLIRKKDDRLVGMINVRWDLDERMLAWAGHIGYAVRPSERQKGYNKVNLYLGLQEAKKAGLDRVMISCAPDNPGSEKTILALGGVYERRGFDPEDGEEAKVYWIDVNDSLDRYRTLYDPACTAEDC